MLGLKGLDAFSLESDLRSRGTFTCTRDLLGYIGALLEQQRPAETSEGERHRQAYRAADEPHACDSYNFV